MFRATIQQRLRQTLNRHPLKEEDFDVEFGTNDMRVQSRVFEELFFKASRSVAFGGIEVVLAPGEIQTVDQIPLVDDRNFIAVFETWVSRVVQDVRAMPAMREAEENRRRINEFEARLGVIEDDYMTREEGDALRRRLDMIEAQLRTQARADGQGDLEIKIENISNAITLAKTLINGARKSVILKFMFRRIVAELGPDMPELMSSISNQLTEGEMG